MYESLLFITPRGQDMLTMRRARVLAIVLLVLAAATSILTLLTRLTVDAFVAYSVFVMMLCLIGFYFLNRSGRFQLTLNAFMIFLALMPLIMGIAEGQPVPCVFFFQLVVCTAAVFGRPSEPLRWAAIVSFGPLVINLAVYKSLLAPTTQLPLPNGALLPSIMIFEYLAVSILWMTAASSYITLRFLNRLIDERTQAEAALWAAHAGLEQQVAARTTELYQSNRLLQQQNDQLMQAQAAVLRSEAKQRALLNAIPDMMLRLDQDGVILDFKAEKGHDLRVPWHPTIGTTIDELMPIAVAQQTKNAIRQALQTDQMQMCEYAIPTGDYIIDGEARVVVSGPNEIVTIIRNITERKHSERMRDAFISTVSHELRTPLTSIRGSLGLIAGGVTGAVSPQVQAMVEIAYSNSERLVRLINDMLDIAKIESGNMPFNLHTLALSPLIEQAVAANLSYAEQFGVCLVALPIAPDVFVQADSDRLLQVMTNLLSNAVKFSPVGSNVEIGAERDGYTVALSVRDHGVGIPEAFHGRIFQKFAQADSSNARAKGGTGLGLSISKAIVEACGGTIGFTSTPGVGTVFTVVLPMCPEECEQGIC